VRIDVHGPQDRVKDVSPNACHDLSCVCRVHTLCAFYGAYADDVPLLGVLRASAVIGAPACNGGYRYLLDGPTKTLVPTMPREEHCLPEDRDAFPRHNTRRNWFSRRDCSLRPSRRLSRSRRPHFAPTLGTVLLMGLARSRSWSPRFRDFESADTFFTRWNFRAWD